MALDKTQFSKIGNVKPPVDKMATRQIFHAECGADAVAAVVTAGYFNPVREQLLVGDRIHVVAAAETAFRVLKVTAVPVGSGNVVATALAFS